MSRQVVKHPQAVRDLDEAAAYIQARSGPERSTRRRTPHPTLSCTRGEARSENSIRTKNATALGHSARS